MITTTKPASRGSGYFNMKAIITETIMPFMDTIIDRSVRIILHIATLSDIFSKFDVIFSFFICVTTFNCFKTQPLSGNIRLLK